MSIETKYRRRLILEILGCTVSIKACSSEITYFSCSLNRVGYASVEIKKGSCLQRAVGFGPTPDEAFTSLYDEIKGKTIVFDAISENRKEINFPDIEREKRIADWEEENAI
jgi:hypothetical protein